MPELRLLGREDCALCEEMLAELRSEPGGEGIALEWVDVDGDDQLRRRYGLRVPVLLDAWDDVVCEGRFDAASFADFLRQSARPAARRPPD